MRFTVLGPNQAYDVNPQLRDLVAAGSGVARRDIVGLHVSSDNSRVIDTDAQAALYGWSDEEKERMERHLLSHPDFGTKALVDRGEQRGDELLNSQVWKLWFSGDQEIPEKYRKFCEDQRWYATWGAGSLDTAPETSQDICLFTDVVGQSVMRCQSPALEGQDYCADHAGALAEVK